MLCLKQFMLVAVLRLLRSLFQVLGPTFDLWEANFNFLLQQLMSTHSRQQDRKLHYPHVNCVYILYTKIVQDVCNWCIQNVYKMHTTFQQAFVSILYTKSKELCQLNFVYILYTKVCRNVEYILYTNILYTFCMHQFWSTESVHHKHYVYNVYTKFIQNVYTNNCMQNGSLISQYFDPFVVHFLVNHCKQLRPETW